MLVVIVQTLECESHLVLYVRFFQCLVPPCCAAERRAQWMEVSGPARESGTQAATEQGVEAQQRLGAGKLGTACFRLAEHCGRARWGSARRDVAWATLGTALVHTANFHLAPCIGSLNFH